MDVRNGTNSEIGFKIDGAILGISLRTFCVVSINKWAKAFDASSDSMGNVS